MSPKPRRANRARVRRLLDRAVSASPTMRSVARRLLYLKRRVDYRRMCARQSVDPTLVIFECYAGRGYSCSPRAIYQCMLADPRYADFTFVWAFREPLIGALNGTMDAGVMLGPGAVDELSHARIVEYASPEYYEVHAQAGYWIANYILPTHMHVRRGQTYVQTWHGTPLKRLGCDIASDKTSSMYSMNDVHRRYAREGARFTRLLSPSPYASENLSGAFALTPERAAEVIIEQGYPRNDFLHTHRTADVATIKNRLGIPDGRTVVLYAPTFRDDQRQAGLGYTIDTGIDFDAFRERLGDSHVVLFRAHYLIASHVDFSRYDGTVIDVSDVSDVNDLYVVSDLLVTDYSSVFFDYANLGRPIIFFPYDLEHYAGDLRGFYLDISELPGPIVRAQEDFFEAIKNTGDDVGSRSEQLARFRERFLSMDDGHAAQRVVDALQLT